MKRWLLSTATLAAGSTAGARGICGASESSDRHRHPANTGADAAFPGRGWVSSAGKGPTDMSDDEYRQWLRDNGVGPTGKLSSIRFDNSGEGAAHRGVPKA
jgi:hypothetical protein